MVKRRNNKQADLKRLLEALTDHNVTEYTDGVLKISLKPKETVVRPVASVKDLSVSKPMTKEQEAEDLLFHSAGR